MTQSKNILLIGMDDAFSFWRFRKAFGVELKLPNLDRICAQSTAFHAAYCQVPVCGPSRASAMSGLSPYETGVLDNYSNIYDVLRPEQMWQFRLKEKGYFCSAAGKIHHGYKPQPPEIHDVMYSHGPRHVFFGPKLDAPHKKMGGRMGGVGTTEPADDRLYYDYRSAQDAIRFLNTYDGSAPFYREVGFHHPHPPFRTPVRFKDMYNVDDFIQPEAWKDGFEHSPFADVFMKENMDRTNLEDWRTSIRNYFSAFSHVDAELGRVWDALKSSAHAENTIVVIWSDHGYHMGDKNRFRKLTLWEEAASIPLIIHDPGQSGRVITDPVALTDMGPTILDYANAPPMRHAVGRSLRPAVEGKPLPPRPAPTFLYGSVSARTGNYRITLYQDGSSELYDVVNDPWQTKNLAGQIPEYDRAMQDLLTICREYGVQVIRKGDRADGPACYYSIHTDATAPDRCATRGMISVGGLDHLEQDPGPRRHFTTLSANDTIDMGNGLSEVLFGADTNGGVTAFGLRLSDRGDRVFFAGGHNRFALEIEGGDGGDRIYTAQERLIARLGRRDNEVSAGNSDAHITGGRGTDQIRMVNGTNTAINTAGRMVIEGGKGHDQIEARGGSTLVSATDGQLTVTISGGQNIIRAHDADVTLTVKRTELPQRIEGFTKGRIDLSDWAALGPVQARSDGQDTLISAGSEQIRFTGTPPATVISAITGATVAA